jgi:hypothetical protein
MFINMIEETDIVTNIYWGAVDLALAQLSMEFKEPTVSVPAVAQTAIKNEKDISFTGNCIPVVVPVHSEEIVKTGGGVNHLNLIQIKGRPAHSWQPRVMQDNLGKLNIYRPTVYSVEVNKIMLKTADKTK